MLAKTSRTAKSDDLEVGIDSDLFDLIVLADLTSDQMERLFEFQDKVRDGTLPHSDLTPYETKLEFCVHRLNSMLLELEEKWRSFSNAKGRVSGHSKAQATVRDGTATH